MKAACVANMRVLKKGEGCLEPKVPVFGQMGGVSKFRGSTHPSHPDGGVSKSRGVSCQMGGRCQKTLRVYISGEGGV